MVGSHQQGLLAHHHESRCRTTKERLAQVIELAKYRAPMAQDDPDHWGNKPSIALSDVITENNELRQKLTEQGEALNWAGNQLLEYSGLLMSLSDIASNSPELTAQLPQLASLFKEIESWQQRLS